MQIDTPEGARIVDFQTCVVFDKETGRIAHIHDSITLEGAEAPSRETFEARAMELARQFAGERPGIRLDQLEILHVRPEELEDVHAPYVDVGTRSLIQKEPRGPQAR